MENMTCINFNKLSNEEAQSLEGGINYSEALEFLKNMKHYKSPCSDIYIFFIPLEESYSNVNSTIMSIHINKNNNNTKKREANENECMYRKQLQNIKKTKKQKQTATTTCAQKTYTESL